MACPHAYKQEVLRDAARNIDIGALDAPANPQVPAMIFQDAQLDELLAGRKTVTRRICVENPRSPWWREWCAVESGQIRAAQRGRGAPREANILIEDVRRETLGALIHGSVVYAAAEVQKEGFAGYHEFHQSWKRIYGPATWASDTEVWRVEFRLAEVLAEVLS